MVTKLDDLLDQYPVGPDPKDPNHDVQAAIRAAYRIGHDDGRNARIRQDEQTFIGQLRERQNGQES